MQINKVELMNELNDHLGFNDKDGTYYFVLTRVKEAFGWGTMDLTDFVEVDEEFVSELADFFIEFVNKR